MAVADRSDGTEDLVRRACAVAARARDAGNHPFGALLVDPGGTVELEAENTRVTTGDCTGHAETNLVRLASTRHSFAELRSWTLVTSTEPCAMCAGAIYWSGIGRVVFGMSESALREITGDDAENPTMALPCREVFARGQFPVVVVGPIDIPEVAQVHAGFWTGG